MHASNNISHESLENKTNSNCYYAAEIVIESGNRWTVQKQSRPTDFAIID